MTNVNYERTILKTELISIASHVFLYFLCVYLCIVVYSCEIKYSFVPTPTWYSPQPLGIISQSCSDEKMAALPHSHKMRTHSFFIILYFSISSFLNLFLLGNTRVSYFPSQAFKVMLLYRVSDIYENSSSRIKVSTTLRVPNGVSRYLKLGLLDATELSN